MNNQLKIVALIVATITICVFTSCAGNKPIPETPVGFEEGIKTLATSLADQVEKSSSVKGKKIAIDPFIDVESGYPMKINGRISQIMAKTMENRFDIGGEIEPDIFGSAAYILNGMATIDPNRKDTHRVFATVFEKTTGKIIASASAWIKDFDTTPKEIYKDSPVFLKGDDYKHQTESVRKPVGETVNMEYFNNLKARSMRVKGDNLYERKDYKQSLSYYKQADELKEGNELSILNGQFTTMMIQAQYKAAEDVYGRLLRASLKETGEITSNICFDPNQVIPIKSRDHYHSIYMKQIAGFVVSRPGCKLKIVGHCSKTGTAAYNDKLSKNRAVWIQGKMATYAASLMSRSTIEGRGFRENIVGTGKDDFTDLIDRRVEFIFYDCNEHAAGRN